jgi:hypothetical protein
MVFLVLPVSLHFTPFEMSKRLFFNSKQTAAIFIFVDISYFSQNVLDYMYIQPVFILPYRYRYLMSVPHILCAIT